MVRIHVFVKNHSNTQNDLCTYSSHLSDHIAFISNLAYNWERNHVSSIYNCIYIYLHIFQRTSKKCLTLAQYCFPAEYHTLAKYPYIYEVNTLRCIVR